MEERPLITVIVPVYNAKQYMDACVESILAQTYRNLELLLINDGSTDGSKENCDNWEGRDERIRALHFENGGAAAARNRGIECAEGEYLAFVDSDDTVTADYLDYLYELMVTMQADIAVCGFCDIYPKNPARRKEDANEIRKVMTGKEAMVHLLYQKYFFSTPWAKLCHKKVLKNVRFPVGTLAEDVGTIYSLMYAAVWVAYGSRRKYQYYHREGSAVYSDYAARNRDYYRHCKEMIEFVEKTERSALKAAVSRHFSACFQILSETPNQKEYGDIYRAIYADVKKYRKKVLMDKNARIRNRGAAFVSYVSVGILYSLARIYRKWSYRKLHKKYAD
jgi:glycosyltransferase involved in cell wall biosynthesis